MRLLDLLPTIAPATADIEISSLAFDSRAVAPGALFFAIPGAKADGARFIPQALAQGAVAILCESAAAQIFVGDDRVIAVSDVRAALAMAAAKFYPRQPATIMAVTGTSGKTSVTAFLRQIWAHCGRSAASLGTIGLVGPTGSVYGSLTTPDPIALHQTLDRLATEGATHLAMEASSHGLDQRRLDGVRLSAAAFTNLSHDHLDYHATLEDYLAAKLRLFDALLAPGQPAVVDSDQNGAAQAIACARARELEIFTIGRSGEAIKLLERGAEGFSTRLSLRHDGRRYQVLLPLAGEFQTSNALVAAGLAISGGEQADAVFAALETLQGAPGRLEFFGARQFAGSQANAGVFVDYAHKPAALENALAALRPFATSRLIVVFGCGGDRDRAKRPIMGEIAARAADVAIVTDDNPRSEDPAAIRAEILAGVRATSHACVREIGDRGAAIFEACRLLRPGDVLLVAGKGHESGQIVGAKVLPFNDGEQVLAALASL